MRRKRLCLTLCVFAFFLAAVILLLWTEEAEKKAHYTPDYAMVDLTEVLQKRILTEDEYALLFRQTGLTRIGIDELYESNRQELLLYLQERFFTSVKVECFRSNIICRSERLADCEAEAGDFLPAVRTGDILVTFSGHVFGWRSGHAAMVVDGEEGLTLEAITIGSSSGICSLEHWREYPCFVLLRLKDISREQAAEIAAYAMEYLSDVSYDLLSLTYMSEPDSIDGTQCAHLVWAVFKHFGYDLDSDGGYIVTPSDICQSGLLEVVQIYGLEGLSGGTEAVRLK